MMQHIFLLNVQFPCMLYLCWVGIIDSKSLAWGLHDTPFPLGVLHSILLITFLSELIFNFLFQTNICIYIIYFFFLFFYSYFSVSAWSIVRNCQDFAVIYSISQFTDSKLGPLIISRELKWPAANFVRLLDKYYPSTYRQNSIHDWMLKMKRRS